jgi:hypothetical protein
MARHACVMVLRQNLLPDGWFLWNINSAIVSQDFLVIGAPNQRTSAASSACSLLRVCNPLLGKGVPLLQLEQNIY